VCREALILGQRNRLQGSGTARHPALLNAVLSTVHAGREQGWESGHLEQASTGKAGRLLQAESHGLVKTGKLLSANNSAYNYALAA